MSNLSGCGRAEDGRESTDPLHDEENCKEGAAWMDSLQIRAKELQRQMVRRSMGAQGGGSIIIRYDRRKTDSIGTI